MSNITELALLSGIPHLVLARLSLVKAGQYLFEVLVSCTKSYMSLDRCVK